MQVRIQFPPEPRSASAARRWVRYHLTRIGRPDLVPAAEAGVSELVTNGILHAQTSIGLQLCRTRGRVIIEVYDASPLSHRPNISNSTPYTPDSTIGRGLRIVRANAREWGVSTTMHGKAIWFQPTTAPTTDEIPEMADLPEAEDDLDADPLDLDAAIESLAEEFPEDGGYGEDGEDGDDAGLDLVTVYLLNAPPMVVHHHRNRWQELVREMWLVALGGESEQQELAHRFCTYAQMVDADMYITEQSAQEYARALCDHAPFMDAIFEVPRSRREVFVNALELARELDEKAIGDHLLYRTPGPQAAQLRDWWLGEFIRQIDGEPPMAWPGDGQVRDDALGGVTPLPSGVDA
ncbi:MAG: ATP-binding protein [Nocardioidaceae bacterium]